MWRLVFTSRLFSTYLVCFVYSLVKMLCKLDSLLLLSSLLEILNLKLFCKSLNIIYYFCKILSCWYFLRSPSCDTSGVFRSACGLEIPVKLHLIKHFNSTGLSHSAQTQSTWAVREWEWALAPCHMGTTANDSPPERPWQLWQICWLNAWWPEEESEMGSENLVRLSNGGSGSDWSLIPLGPELLPKRRNDPRSSSSSFTSCLFVLTETETSIVWGWLCNSTIALCPGPCCSRMEIRA